MRISPYLTAIFCCVGAMSANAQPMSAIDWLTDSVAVPPSIGLPENDVAATQTRGPISVRPIDGPSLDMIGLQLPESLGLPDTLWEQSDPATLSRLIARAQVQADSPATRGLLIDLLTLAARPPSVTEVEGELLLARIDRLLDLGALGKAAALLEQTDLTDPRLFKRWFDVRLLMGTEDVACDRLTANPDLSPTFTTTIFCLARAGDWNAAALTLDTAEALGLITPAEDALLLRFLDETNATDNGPLTLPAHITPLTFRLYEAVGEPIPTEILPRAFAHTDLAPQNGWKARLAAAERLTAGGVLDPNILMEIYSEQRPAASGGVWDRARAVQALEQALGASDAIAIGNALPTAWSALGPSHLTAALAQNYGDKLAMVNLTGNARTLSLRAGLLSQSSTLAAEKATADPSLAFAAALSSAADLPPPGADPGARLIAEAFAGSTLPPALRALVDEGRSGEAALEAISLFTAGANGDADDLIHAVRLFRAIGLDKIARRASLEYLILDRRG